jgi:hypothetical protein
MQKKNTHTQSPESLVNPQHQNLTISSNNMPTKEWEQHHETAKASTKPHQKKKNWSSENSWPSCIWNTLHSVNYYGVLILKNQVIGWHFKNKTKKPSETYTFYFVPICCAAGDKQPTCWCWWYQASQDDENVQQQLQCIKQARILSWLFFFPLVPTQNTGVHSKS